MIDVNEILKNEKAIDIITALKQKSTVVPSWKVLSAQYYPEMHDIMTDKEGRKDKIHSDGSKDKAARLPIALEKLLTQRMAEFTFAIPVKRVYTTDGSEEQAEIEKAIEKIYKIAHIDNVNLERARAYYASCEIFTVWYIKEYEHEHNLYGFPCKFKLKCKTLSPMEGVDLYPLIDSMGEMHAMSFEYREKVRDVYVTYFETYTAESHYVWKHDDDGDWVSVKSEEDISIGKIRGVYLSRKAPIWAGLVPLRNDIEYTLSRNSDVIAYNSSPILKVAGAIVGDEQKGETRRIYRVEEGGDVSYVSWSQSIAALEYHVRTLLNLYFMQAQIPDISFENMRGLGNIGYDARKLLFTDAHMKVGEESGAWLEFLEREANVIKAFLKKMNTSFKEEDIDSIFIQQVITPYVQEDDAANIDKWMKANGNIPLVSPLESIRAAGLSDDPEKTLEQVLAYQMMMNDSGNEQQVTNEESVEGGEGGE